MAKLLGPDFISLQVRDLSTSRAFYTGGVELDHRSSIRHSQSDRIRLHHDPVCSPAVNGESG